MPELRLIPLVNLDPHPDNPRVSFREDVLAALVANIGDEFPQKHAIHVRPVGDRFQILSGHTRTEAARRKGLTEVWAWVEDLDDDAAFMELVTSNSQGELSPLEVGIHALKAVPKAKGGKGKKGGLSEYAGRVGKDESYIRQLLKAAEVVAETSELTPKFLDKSQHLCALHKLPRACWAEACAWLADGDVSVADVESRVKNATEFGHQNGITHKWHSVFPIDRCIAAIFSGRHSAGDFHRLHTVADRVHGELPDDLAVTWKVWLEANAGGAAWNMKMVREKQEELERAAWEREQAKLTEDERFSVHACDFRTAPVEDGSVDVIVTDPPYPEEFIDLYGDLSAFAARVLKPGGSMFVMCGHSYLDRLMPLMGRHMNYHWTLAYLTPGGQAVQCWDRKVNTFWKPVFWYVKGRYQGDWLGDVCKSAVNDNDKNHHHWGQSVSGMTDILERVSRPGDLVCDPFLGGGTTGAVAVRLGRRFVGVELDVGVAEAARVRIHQEATEAAV